ncbi:MAG: YaiI/YqxD family protein [Gemmataceae bacterium]
MAIIYVDADACPVKAEVYRVASRYGIRVVVVANNPLRVPADSLVELIVVPGFGAADDYIATTIKANDIAVTADVPLAARCVAQGAVVIDTKGRLLTDTSVGNALATRDLMQGLRDSGMVTGGPAPMQPKDRSRFLAKLDEVVNAVMRGKTPR